MNRLLLTLLMLISGSALAELSVAEISEQLAAANALHEEAKAAHHSWIATRRLMDQAQAALDAGDLAEAEALAARAYKTAAASVAQMHNEKTAWQARVPQTK